MTPININSRVIDNINSDNLMFLLNNLIDEELNKNVESIDTEFVDECVSALLEIEKDEENLAILIPLISSDKFLKKITSGKQSSFKNLNIFARTAIIAAIIAGSTMSANAMLYSITGVNVLENIAERIENSIDWEDDDTEIEESQKNTENTTVSSNEAVTSDNNPNISEGETTTITNEPTVTEINSSDEENETTKAEIVSTTGKSQTDNTEKASSDNDEEKDKSSYESTTIPAKEPVTSPPPIVTDKKDGKAFTGISADISNFKTDYIYGENFSYDGLELYANYDNGDKEALSLDDCYYTKIYTTDETADYTLTIIYKTCKLEIKITVRPDEYTRGSEICSNGIYDYLLTDEGAYITAYKGNDASLDMGYAGDKKIVAVCANVFEGSNVENVSADYVTKIFKNAFKDCASLISCNTPNAVYIGDNAFDGCVNLSEITYSENADYLGKASFRKTSLTNAVVPQGITVIPDSLFEDCTSLKNVDFTGKVTEIGKNAFADCSALEKITGCDSIEAVNEYAFYGNELMDIDVFPQNIKTVGDCAFYLCQKLDIGSLPQSITSLGKSAFAYCTGLTEITVPDGITVVPYEAFRGTGAKSVTIPEGVEVIEDYAFRAIKATTINLPNSLKKIGANGIYSPLLRKIYFGNNLEKIADDAVYPSRSVVLYVYENSLAMKYAVDNSISYEIINQEG